MICRAAIVILFLLGGAPPALADEASEALLSDYVAWVDSSPDWSASVSFIRSDGPDTFAEGLVFSRADPNISISIERLKFGRLEAREDGGFRAAAIDMEGAAIAANDLRYTIPSATVEAVSVPVMPGLDFDPRRLMTLAARAYSALAKAEFSDLGIPEMTGSSVRSSAETGDTVSASLVYRNLAIGGLKDGIATGLAAGPISLRVSGADGETEFAVKSVISDRVDAGAFAHIFDPANYRNGEGDRVRRPILSTITYSGLSASGPHGSTLALETLALENLEGRQLDEPFTPIWDKLLDLAVAEEEKPGFALDLLRSYAAWRVGALRLGGFRVDLKEEEASLSLDDLSLSGLSSGGIDSLTLKSLRGTAPDWFLSLGSLELAGFVSPDLEALIQFAALEPDIDPKMHAEAIAKTFAALPRLSRFGAHEVAAGASQADSYSLKNFTLDFSRWNDVFAEATEMRLDGLKIAPDLLGPDSARMLGALGFDELVLGVTLSDRWKPETGAYDADWTFTLGGAGGLQLSYTLSGVTRDWLVKATAAAGGSEDSEKAVMAMLDELRLRRATLSLTDRSLLERAFGYAAELQELDVDGRTYREQMRAALPFLISAAMPPAITKLLAKPLQQFLTGGQTLIADINPAAPLNLTEMLAEAGDPLALPDRLNMTLRTEASSQ